ncbi:MAG: RCC1 repeat-containing protein [Comamonadaceae bacterium PBBC2]|nr:MAG: RCC1 repeat-containing protein [Comamonadaceae bacterium PBBC2]
MHTQHKTRKPVPIWHLGPWLLLACALFGAALSAPSWATTPMVVAGSYHTCALQSGGDVQCWGANDSGQLGNGTQRDSAIPVAVRGINTATHISAGATHTCVVLSGGTVQCWGGLPNRAEMYVNDLGQVGKYFTALGNGTTKGSAIPVVATGVSNAVAVSAGSDHTCALLADSTLQCWGRNWYGAVLGNQSALESTTPVAVPAVNRVIAVSAGGYHTCVLLRDGAVQCWGSNYYGQTGNGSRSDSATVGAVAGVRNAIAISAGSDSSCAVLGSGTVQCWGSKISDKLGTGNTTVSAIPLPVEGLSNVTSVSTKYGNACVTLSSGAVQCWGLNFSGQLGNGSTSGSATPATVAGMGHVSAVAVGGTHSCATLSTGPVQCWGNSNYGQLGNNSVGTSAVPLPVVGMGQASAISAGDVHTCVRLRTGAVQCWGANTYGQLGNGSLDSTTPLTVSGISDVAAVSAGGTHSCALLASGTVQCWGDNRQGQLGDGSLTASTQPVAVLGISTAVALSAGHAHNCAVLAGGSVQCWGYGHNLAAGIGGNISSGPVAVSGISDAVAISAGSEHTCAVRRSGTVQCWGSNGTGQLGNGTTTLSYSPVSVSGISTAIAVSAGTSHTCALLSSGAVQCWGTNYYGQLGIGSNADSDIPIGYYPIMGKLTYSTTPVTVMGISNAAALTSRADHTCTLLSDGTTQCWGYNGTWQLSDGTRYNVSSSPLAISAIRNATSVAAGATHSCALLADGTAQCWGQGRYYGQGGADKAFSYTPVPVMDGSSAGFLDTSSAARWADTDKVLAWGEKTNPQTLAPAGQASQELAGYRYRRYPGDHILAVNAHGPANLYYWGPLSNYTVLELGLLSGWLLQAKP